MGLPIQLNRNMTKEIKVKLLHHLESSGRDKANSNWKFFKSTKYKTFWD